MARLGEWVLVLALACAHAGCAHTREAEDASSAEAPRPEAGEQPAEGSAAQPARAPGEQPQQGSLGGGGLVAGGPKDPEQIPVSTSAGGLLKPGAEKAVRDKLGVKGKGGLRAALQKFQRSHDLPATGMLDHETAKQLGLDPDEIFERAGAE